MPVRPGRHKGGLLESGAPPTPSKDGSDGRRFFDIANSPLPDGACGGRRGTAPTPDLISGFSGSACRRNSAAIKSCRLSTSVQTIPVRRPAYPLPLSWLSPRSGCLRWGMDAPGPASASGKAIRTAALSARLIPTRPTRRDYQAQDDSAAIHEMPVFQDSRV